MCNLIKKQIKRSLPLFLIFTLLTSSVVGLLFNFDFDLFDGNHFSMPEVQAQTTDTASTTVTVLNAPPAITSDPAEVPPSASTTPRNVGGSIGFTVTADDPEGNTYYLIVCDANSVLARNGNSPTCNGANMLCRSSTTTDETASTCTYDPITDPGAEFRNWYAFVCDTHATEAICSVASQGTAGANSASPFYINHAPSFTLVSTYDDNKNPGNTMDPFIVRATTTDNDVMGQPDGQQLFVCLTNQWSTTTGCAIELCRGSATSTDYVECSFATTTVAADGEWNYYAFVKDWHNFAGNNGNSRSAKYNVNNVAPSVGSVVIHSSVDIVLRMKGMSEVYATTTTVNATDNNGCSDIEDATSTIYWSSATSSQNCVANDNYCYRMGLTECAVVPASCGVYPDATVTIICTTTMAYHALATDNATNNPFEGTNWLAGLTAIDDNNARGTGISALGVDVRALEALHVTEDAIAYGSVRGGQNSGTRNATTTITNYGNIPIDSQILGTDMDKTILSGYIRATYQKYDLIGFDYTAGTFTLSSTTPSTPDITAPKPTSQASTSDQLYWGIAIPGGTTSGDYAGVNTFTAILDDNNW
jgi:hypothetical protein